MFLDKIKKVVKIEEKERNENKNMVKLRELTKTLPDYIKTNVNNRVDYNLNNGTSHAFGLLFNEDIAVANTFISKGSIFPKHVHNEKEFIILYKGEILVYIYDDDDTIYKKVNMKKGSSIYIEVKQKHIIKALEDSWLIAITIPAAEGFPHERKQ